MWRRRRRRDVYADEKLPEMAPLDTSIWRRQRATTIWYLQQEYTNWPKPIATSTWLGHLILCILWTWRWTLPTGSSVGTQWTSYIQQDCEMEPVLQLTFSPTRLSGQGNRCMFVMSGSGGGCCKLEPPWAHSECVSFFQSAFLLNYSPTDKD